MISKNLTRAFTAATITSIVAGGVWAIGSLLPQNEASSSSMEEYNGYVQDVWLDFGRGKSMARVADGHSETAEIEINVDDYNRLRERFYYEAKESKQVGPGNIQVCFKRPRGRKDLSIHDGKCPNPTPLQSSAKSLAWEMGWGLQ